MKICILRRDGENVHNGMVEVIIAVSEVNPLYAVRILK